MFLFNGTSFFSGLRKRWQFFDGDIEPLISVKCLFIDTVFRSFVCLLAYVRTTVWPVGQSVRCLIDF